MDDHEEPVFDLSQTPLAAGIEAEMGNPKRLDQIAPEPQTEPEKKRWNNWSREKDCDAGY